eukprot:140068-Chlamydomonas_euryale.AAC.7
MVGECWAAVHAEFLTCLVPSGVAASSPSISTHVPVGVSLFRAIPEASAASLVTMHCGRRVHAARQRVCVRLCVCECPHMHTGCVQGDRHGQASSALPECACKAVASCMEHITGARLYKAAMYWLSQAHLDALRAAAIVDLQEGERACACLTARLHPATHTHGAAHLR